MPDLESLLKRLVDHRVEFVIVGGYAAVAHGSTIVTQDLDICCRFSPTNLLRLQKSMSDLHPVHRMTPARLPLRLSRQACGGLRNLYLDTDYGPLDCLGEIKGVGGFDVVRKHSMVIDLDYGRCRMLDLDTLIKAKKAMGEPRDLQAVAELTAIRKKSTPVPRRRSR
ncbi:MAG: nucleotidyltransferase [Verrucomicrobiota bacterium]